VNFFRQIVQKPWVPVVATADELIEGREFPDPPIRIGLRVFLGVVTVIFSLLVISYFGRMAYNDWRAFPEPWLLWLNTALLISSSVAFHQSLSAIRRGKPDRVKDGLLFGGLLATCFLVGQLLIWQQMVASGFYAEANPANAFFFVLTGLHALHLLGGLVAWGKTGAKLLAGMESDKLRQSLELAALYWDYLLLIWLVLFGLLIFT